MSGTTYLETLWRGTAPIESCRCWRHLVARHRTEIDIRRCWLHLVARHRTDIETRRRWRVCVCVCVCVCLPALPQRQTDQVQLATGKTCLSSRLSQHTRSNFMSPCWLVVRERLSTELSFFEYRARLFPIMVKQLNFKKAVNASNDKHPTQKADNQRVHRKLVAMQNAGRPYPLATYTDMSWGEKREMSRRSACWTLQLHGCRWRNSIGSTQPKG